MPTRLILWFFLSLSTSDILIRFKNLGVGLYYLSSKPFKHQLNIHSYAFQRVDHGRNLAYNFRVRSIF